ncbi:hypothetical protein OG263_49045 [Streptomyces canus]|nr:hypothetical protein [Streptomyces canus]MCX4861521.1 hypothetical protein [Streptomyces canus]
MSEPYIAFPDVEQLVVDLLKDRSELAGVVVDVAPPSGFDGSQRAVPSAADILRRRYPGRLPDSLEDLAGPAHGRIDLPLHVAWSGLRTYDLDRPRQRMSLYRTVLAEGQGIDIISLLNRDLPLDLWPCMRTMISRHVREVWEETFPELAQSG